MPLARISPDVEQAVADGVDGPRDADEESPSFIPSDRTRDAIVELDHSGAGVHGPRLIGELIAAERRGQLYLALIPFFGPWFIQRSEVHSGREKLALASLSACLTALVAWLALALISRGAVHATAPRGVGREGVSVEAPRSGPLGPDRGTAR